MVRDARALPGLRLPSLMGLCLAASTAAGAGNTSESSPLLDGLHAVVGFEPGHPGLLVRIRNAPGSGAVKSPHVKSGGRTLARLKGNWTAIRIDGDDLLRLDPEDIEVRGRLEQADGKGFGAERLIPVAIEATAVRWLQTLGAGGGRAEGSDPTHPPLVLSTPEPFIELVFSGAANEQHNREAFAGAHPQMRPALLSCAYWFSPGQQVSIRVEWVAEPGRSKPRATILHGTSFPMFDHCVQRAFEGATISPAPKAKAWINHHVVMYRPKAPLSTTKRLGAQPEEKRGPGKSVPRVEVEVGSVSVVEGEFAFADAAQRRLRGRTSSWQECASLIDLAAPRRGGALRVVLLWTLDDDGARNIEVQGEHTTEAFDRCLIKTVEKIRFQRKLSPAKPPRLRTTLRFRTRQKG